MLISNRALNNAKFLNKHLDIIFVLRVLYYAIFLWGTYLFYNLKNEMFKPAEICEYY